ncbi:MAG: aminoglycoside phosphotransferase family protein [Halioglobus sp.]
MSIALPDNPDHIYQLCSHLDLGQPAAAIRPVHGGFHHRMWRLQTDKAVYAVKQLSSDTDVADPAVIAHFNLTETVANTFRDYGIHAVSARSCRGEYLHLLDNTAYLVYPWVEASALPFSQLSESHALEVADILATMHRADIRVPGLGPKTADMHAEETITAVIGRAGAEHVRYTRELEQGLPAFLDIGRDYKAAILVLAQHLVVSHGDLDQKNVLWDSAGKSLLIDWESAHQINPVREVLQTALEWSGITRQLDPLLFETFLSAYQRAGGVIADEFVEPALRCILGDWLNWLMYVVDRASMADNPIKRIRGAEQFDLVFTTLQRLDKQLPELLAMPALRKPGNAA